MYNSKCDDFVYCTGCVPLQNQSLGFFLMRNWFEWPQRRFLQLWAFGGNLHSQTNPTLHSTHGRSSSQHCTS